MEIKCAFDEQQPISTLLPNPRNPNKHPKEQIKLLAKIMKYQGWRSPIVVSNQSGFITKGHGRREAALLNGWTEAPVDFQDYSTSDEEYADMVADNKIAELAESSMDMILSDAAQLMPGFDLELLGIPEFKLPEELQGAEDEVPEEIEPKTQLGDLYLLGDHRLYCGDSTDKECVEKLMNGEKAEMGFTSPPYNASKKRENNGDLNPTNKYSSNADNLSDDEYLNFLQKMLSFYFLSAKEIFINIQLIGTNRDVVLHWVNNNKKNIKDIIYWVKDNAAPHIQPNVTSNHVEWIVVFSQDHPDRKFRNIPEARGQLKNKICGPNSSGNEFADIHKATFPVYLPEQMIETYTSSSMSVVDLFGGTGSTLIACEKTKRKCFMMELDPHYCDVIVARWEKYTGKKAELCL